VQTMSLQPSLEGYVHVSPMGVHAVMGCGAVGHSGWGGAQGGAMQLQAPFWQVH
jgi:hypothetical protein